MMDRHPRPIAALPEAEPLKTWRCPKCGTILAKLCLVKGSVVEIKCGRCNAFAVKQAA